MMRTSTLNGFGSPSGLISPDSRKRSSLGCKSRLISPISSRNSVPSLRGADDAEVIAVGAGERAAPMAEQLALEQVARHRGAVERDERLLRARREVVDGAGEDFLAGAAFAGDQDRDVGSRDLACGRHHVAHPSGNDRVAILERQFVARPQGQAFLALDAGLFEVADRAEQHGDAVDRRQGFIVRQRLDPEFDGAIVRRADRKHLDVAVGLNVAE